MEHTLDNRTDRIMDILTGKKPYRVESRPRPAPRPRTIALVREATDLRYASSPIGFEAAACRELNRYYGLLHETLMRLNLADKEAMFLVKALEGEVHTGDDETAYAAIEKALWNEALCAEWAIDAEKFGEWAEALSPGELWAILDGVERYHDMVPVEDGFTDLDRARVALRAKRSVSR
jgi:hypothetical protein